MIINKKCKYGLKDTHILQKPRHMAHLGQQYKMQHYNEALNKCQCN